MLENLNIVVAPAANTAASKPKQRKKKNNKYERRRQRAQKAKEERSGNTKQGKESDSPKETPRQKVHDNGEELSALDRTSELDSTTPSSVPAATTTTTTTSRTAAPLQEDETTKEAQISTGTPADEFPSDSEDEGEASPVTPEESTKNSPSDSDQPEEPVLAPSRRRRAAKEADAEEHAKYLAEFHARPMELDRRSGARNAFVVSQESKHIFDESTVKDWNSVKSLHPNLIKAVTNQLDLEKPTRIQLKSLQTFAENQTANILLHSETGSGKTLAYALPLLQSLAVDSKNGELMKKSRSDMGTQCLVLCPTRELASQTFDTLEQLCRFSFQWIVVGSLSGGDTRKSEKARIRKGLGIIVATPGRLLDHLQKTESLSMSLKGKLKYLVLDEADRLLDMGLGDQVKQIVQHIRANDASTSSWWRSVLVSATVTPSVESLAKERMLCGENKWVWVKGAAKKSESVNETASNDPSSFSESTPRQLAQQHLTVSAKMRLSTLIAFLTQRVKKKERVVVFMGTCASVDYHFRLLNRMDNILDGNNDNDTSGGIFGKKAELFKLHGNVQHAIRGQVLKHFAKCDKSKSAILFSTDVAARGLNLKNCDFILQYDPPCEISDYVHRVGRVARAGQAGHSLLMLLPSERSFLDVLESKGVSNMTAVSLANTLNDAAAHCKDLTTAGKKHVGAKESSVLKGSRLGEAFSAELQRRLEDCVADDDATTKAKWKETPKRKRSAIMKQEGELLSLARDAFISFIRAYPTKEKCVRHIFSARALHLGHIARSFALKEPPKALSNKHKANASRGRDDFMDEEKPSSKMEFKYFSDDEDGDEEQRSKKRSKNQLQQTKKKPDGINIHDDSARLKRAKALLLENAKKMQSTGGLDEYAM